MIVCLKIIEDKKESEEKEKDKKDTSLAFDVEASTVITEGAEVVEMSTEIAVKEEEEESKDADVIKTEISSAMQE